MLPFSRELGIAVKSHVQAKKKAYKSPEYPPMARAAIKDMDIDSSVKITFR